MIKTGIKNYFMSLKHFFTPLGTMFLGVMIGISVMIPGMISAFSDLLQEIKNLGDNLNLDFHSLWNSVWEKVLALDWNMPLESLEILLSKEWMNQTLNDILTVLLGTDFETFKVQIEILIHNFTISILGYGILFFTWWMIGFIAGYVLLRFLIRRNIARRGVWKYILSIIFNGILSALLVVILAVLYVIWKPSFFISFIVMLFLEATFNLFTAYLIHGRKKVKISDIVNFKNVAGYLLTTLFIFLIALSFSLIVLVINALLGIFVALSLFEIAFLVISMNAESYVKVRVEECSTTVS